MVASTPESDQRRVHARECVQSTIEPVSRKWQAPPFPYRERSSPARTDRRGAGVAPIGVAT